MQNLLLLNVETTNFVVKEKFTIYMKQHVSKFFKPIVTWWDRVYQSLVDQNSVHSMYLVDQMSSSIQLKLDFRVM